MPDSLSADLASLKIARDVPPPRGGLWMPLLLGAVALAGSLLAVWLLYPYAEAQLFKTEVSATEIALVSPAQASVDLTSTGFVIAQISSKVGARVDGSLAQVLVKEGDVVKAGDLLAVLEGRVQRSALSTARARAQVARARVQAARANLAEAELRAERERRLVARGAGVEANARDAEARVAALTEQVRSAEADVRTAELEARGLGVSLDHTRITAPIDGTVVTRPMKVGELIGPATGPLLELADFSSLVVETDVPESRLHLVKPDAPAEIVLDAYPSRRYRGTTLEIVPRVNRAKATVPVKVRFVDPPEGVLPDMAARVSFLHEALDEKAIKQPPRLVVPQVAVTERAGVKVVFVIDSGQVRMTPVTLGAPFGSGFELERGPPQGTRVVKNPPEKLADGQRIKEIERND